LKIGRKGHFFNTKAQGGRDVKGLLLMGPDYINNNIISIVVLPGYFKLMVTFDGVIYHSGLIIRKPEKLFTRGPTLSTY
jgi:hypothetical protein